MISAFDFFVFFVKRSNDKFMNKDKLTESLGFCFKWREGDLLTFEEGSAKKANKRKPPIMTTKTIFCTKF